MTRLNDWCEYYPPFGQEGPPLLKRMTDEEQIALDKFRSMANLVVVDRIEARP